MAAGFWMLKMGFLKPVSEMVATETASAVEVSAGAVARGVKEGLGGSTVFPSSIVVKVKCRACGYLESDDAKFCSSCRAEI